MLAAFGAIANGGRLMQPHVVRAVVDGNGKEIRRIEPEAVRQVISPETAATLTGILTSVVAEGTGHKAQVEGYAVAGKTGTAQKLDPATRAYSRKPGVLSFIGFAPAGAPRLVMLALLDEPKTVVWGSEGAAPIFATVAGQVLRHLDVPPGEGMPPVQIVRGGPSEGSAVPVGLAGAALSVGSLDAADGDRAVMPDVTGRTLRQALSVLAAYDVDVSVRGRGVVVRQSPAPGATISPGVTCRLDLLPPAMARLEG
jgi:cell division protein FtsI (penicillin-binding protein 3)